jgi:hypothetical protein
MNISSPTLTVCPSYSQFRLASDSAFVFGAEVGVVVGAEVGVVVGAEVGVVVGAEVGAEVNVDSSFIEGLLVSFLVGALALGVISVEMETGNCLSATKVSVVKIEDALVLAYPAMTPTNVSGIRS